MFPSRVSTTLNVRLELHQVTSSIPCLSFLPLPRPPLSLPCLSLPLFLSSFPPLTCITQVRGLFSPNERVKETNTPLLLLLLLFVSLTFLSFHVASPAAVLLFSASRRPFVSSPQMYSSLFLCSKFCLFLESVFSRRHKVASCCERGSVVKGCCQLGRALGTRIILYFNLCSCRCEGRTCSSIPS